MYKRTYYIDAKTQVWSVDYETLQLTQAKRLYRCGDVAIDGQVGEEIMYTTFREQIQVGPYLLYISVNDMKIYLPHESIVTWTLMLWLGSRVPFHLRREDSSYQNSLEKICFLHKVCIKVLPIATDEEKYILCILIQDATNKS